MANHIIQQQNLHLSFYGEMKSEDLSVRLSRWQNEKLLPAMEAVLNEAGSQLYRIRIETLNINAGETVSENWEDILVEKICRLLKQEIREAALKTSLGIEAKANEKNSSFYSKTEKQNLVLNYLKTGGLPWYAAVDVSTLMQWMEEAIGEGFFTNGQSLNFFKENNNAYQRFLRQAKPALLEQWSNQWLTQEQKALLPYALGVASKLFGQSHAALEWTYGLLFDCSHTSWQPLWQTYLNNDQSSLIDATNNFLQQNISAKEWQAKLDKLGIEPVSKPSAAKDEFGDDAFFISNAGLVLLHPFLKFFFSNLHFLTEKGEWLNDDAQRRAVLLLNFICTAKTEAADYDLPLCKLLLGCHLDTPIEPRIKITDEERREAEDLLRTVIAQWSILKTTSVEGLQNSFLVRNGKLKKTDNGWLLQVEQKAYDVLLSHVPWSIGVMKTLWMSDLLFTEWA